LHQRIEKLGVVDMTGNAIKPSVAYPTNVCSMASNSAASTMGS